MTTNYLARSQAELIEITTAFATANAVLTQLQTYWANPQCGKPGLGFKAARKARKEITVLQQQTNEARQTIEAWITRNGKSSKIEAEKRRARVIAVLPEFYS